MFPAMEKPIGTLHHVGQLDSTMKANFERLRHHATVEMAKCDEAINIQKAFIAQTNADIQKIRASPQKLCDKNFVTMNGKRLETDTIASLEQKVKVANDVIKNLEKQRSSAVSRVKLTEIFTDMEDFVEIQEPYSPEALKTGTSDTKKVSMDDFDDVMKRLDELEKQEMNNGELDTNFGEECVKNVEKAEINSYQLSSSSCVNVVTENARSQCQSSTSMTLDETASSETPELAAPKGISQADFDALIKKVDELVASSNSDSDYSDEDNDEEEERYSNDNLTPPKKTALLPTVSPKPLLTSQPERRRSVAFAPMLERGPSPVSTIMEPKSAPTKSILRNKDVKTPVNEAAVRAMDESNVKYKRILPASDAFRGIFIERNLMMLGSNTSNSITETKKPISRFKQHRKEFH